jgi:hypothetical protein
MMLMSKRKPGRPAGRQEVVLIQTRIPPALAGLLRQAAKANHRSANAEILVAIERHVEAMGLKLPGADGPAAN